MIDMSLPVTMPFEMILNAFWFHSRLLVELREISSMFL